MHTKLHPGPEWDIFYILTGEYIDDIISHICTVFPSETPVYILIKRKLHGGLKLWLLFSRGKNNILFNSCGARS